jgi:hypothetical protein
MPLQSLRMDYDLRIGPPCPVRNWMIGADRPARPMRLPADGIGDLDPELHQDVPSPAGCRPCMTTLYERMNMQELTYSIRQNRDLALALRRAWSGA